MAMQTTHRPLPLSRRALMLGGVAGLAPALHAAARPNILLIVSDDQRFDTIHARGNRAIHTPHLDRLVKHGVTFTNAYVSNPICTPSRACLLAGVDDWKTGVRWFGEPIRRTLPLLPETLGAQRYETFFTGKWHNDSTPDRHGFTRTSRVFAKGMGPHEMSFVENGKTASGPSSELFAGAFIDYVKSGPKEPYFAMVAFTAPHDPRTPVEHWASRYDASRMPLPRNFMPKHPFDNGELEIRDEKLLPVPRTAEAVRAEIAKYYAMISHMDEQIGRMMEALETSGQAENTIVAFVSDNGLALGSHGLLGKMSMYDHSVKVPMILQLPGNRFAGRKVDALCYSHQIFATVCELARTQAPLGIAESLAPLMEKKSKGAEMVFSSYRAVQRMVRTHEWKLIWYPEIDKRQLFNMKHDPDELTDLAGDVSRKDLVNEMGAHLAEHMKACGDPLHGRYKPL